MLSESGVLFLSEHTPLGRRWVMPMRLPPTQPEALLQAWEALSFEVSLSLSYGLHLAPPGITERLMAACYGLGSYHQFWRRGALIRTADSAGTGTGGGLLIELRTRADAHAEPPPPPTAGEGLPGSEDQPTALGELTGAGDGQLADGNAVEGGGVAGSDRDVDGEGGGREGESTPSPAPPPLHTLVCMVRGPDEARDALHELLSHVKVRAERILADFPGLGEPEPTIRGIEASALAVAARPSTALAGGSGHTPGRRAEALITLPHAPPPSSASQHTLGRGWALPAGKYVGALKYGRPIEAAQGLHRLLGISDADDLKQLRMRGEDSIRREVLAARVRAKDALGWTDADWLQYMSEQAAGERPLPAGMPAPLLDSGRRGERLDDFCRLDAARLAGLKRGHVLALRLYTSSVFRTINACLHHGCSEQRPHPYPGLVALLAEAIQLMRKAGAPPPAVVTVGANNGAAPSATTWEGASDTSASSLASSSVVWHGAAGPSHGMILSAEFRVRGGCCLGFLSASADRAVAERYADGGGGGSGCGDDEINGALEAVPVLLRLSVPTPKHCGAPIRWLSAYPHEEEVVYGPGTYLRPMGPPSLLVCSSVRADRNGCARLMLRLYRVLEVVPLPREDIGP